MNLSEAIAKFEAKFEKVQVQAKPDPDCPVVWSGGIGPKDSVAPCLYRSKDVAVEHWLQEACHHIDSNDILLEWVEKPELITYQITMTDRRQMHRLVNDRYAVRSRWVAWPGPKQLTQEK